MKKYEALLSKLSELIEQDLRKAQVRKEAFDEREHGFSFNQGVVNTLATIQFDIAELKRDLKIK
jgi:hypothetical protein